MSNQDNELDQDSFDTDLGFDDGPDEGGGKKKNNPLLKIGLIAGGLVVVLVGIMFMGGGSKTDGPQSAVGANVASNNSLPAQKEPTPEYREALENYNQQIVEQAQETGQSAIPIPIDPARRQLQTSVQQNQEDPAERFRRIQEEYRRQQEVSTQQNQQVQADAAAHQQTVQQLSQSMANYLSSALGSRQPTGSKDLSILLDLPTADEATAAAGTTGLATGVNAANLAAAAKVKVLIPATTIEYGQLMIEANSDSPGPVLALMVTGKLAGSRLLGSFQKQDRYLTLNFTQLVTKKGESIPIQAIALDPDTTLPGVITEIDHRYFQRVIVPAAAEFISGVGEALAETQTSTTQNDSSTTTSSNDPDFSEAIAQGISDSFDNAGDTLKDDAGKVEPMLRVAAGTPVGILFTAQVVDPESVQQQQQQLQQQQQQQSLYGQIFPGQVNGMAAYPGVVQQGQTTGQMTPYGMVSGYIPQAVSGYLPTTSSAVPSATTPVTTSASGTTTQ